MRLLVLLFLIFLFFPIFKLQAQKHGTSKKKNQYKGDIEYSQKLLPKNGKASTKKLIIVKRQINTRNALIKEIKEDISKLDQQILLNQDTIETYKLNLKLLSKEYEKMVQIAYKNKSEYERLMFILSANSFNQAYKRLRILKYYSEYRQQQSKLIVEQKNKYQFKVSEFTASKEEKIKLLQSYNVETSELENQLALHTHIMDDLAQNEIQIKDELEKTNKLNSQINSIVKETLSNSANKNLTNYTKIQKGGLDNNKGKLPWPVKHGIILSYFGEQSHPFLRGVMVKNDGIDISTVQNSNAFSVYEGIVKKIVSIPGANYAVLVAHNDFYTLYSNLSQIKVHSGEHVKIGQELGTIYTNVNDNNLTILQFQIWHSSKKLNPVSWLKRDKIN